RSGISYTLVALPEQARTATQRKKQLFGGISSVCPAAATLDCSEAFTQLGLGVVGRVEARADRGVGEQLLRTEMTRPAVWVVVAPVAAGRGAQVGRWRGGAVLGDVVARREHRALGRV